MPLEQLPLSHIMPQLPQLAASLNVLVHAEPPGLPELGQQSGSGATHTVPHVPQLLLSPSVPLAQAQLPLWQVPPEGGEQVVPSVATGLVQTPVLGSQVPATWH
jgi:hypothetical protein